MRVPDAKWPDDAHHERFSRLPERHDRDDPRSEQDQEGDARQEAHEKRGIPYVWHSEGRNLFQRVSADLFNRPRVRVDTKPIKQPSGDDDESDDE